jgi:hypothetical protein
MAKLVAIFIIAASVFACAGSAMAKKLEKGKNTPEQAAAQRACQPECRAEQSAAVRTQKYEAWGRCMTACKRRKLGN